MDDFDMQPQGQESPEVSRGHEVSDIGLGGILTFFGMMILLSTLSYFSLQAFYGRFEQAMRQREAVPRPRSRDEPRSSSPRLQQDPAFDMAAFRAQERARLGSYGWVDREKGIARIPIDRAMEIFVARSSQQPREAQP